MHWQHRFNHMVGRYNDIYRVQMPNITPHVCRHTYCSNMAKSGMNPKTLPIYELRDELIAIGEGKIQAMGPAREVVTKPLIARLYQTDVDILHAPRDGAPPRPIRPGPR